MPSIVERKLVEQALRSGELIPDRIANAPELQIGLSLYLDAFFDLDSERNSGMSLAPIPWTAIKDYAKAYEFDDDQTEDLIFFVKRMDRAHLDRLASKNGETV